MSSTNPNLPAELIELIISHIAHFPDLELRISALSSLALVSRAFRDRAHLHLFERVKLCQTAYKPITPRIHRLRELIYADPKSEHTGLASRIRSFELEMNFGSHWRGEPDPMTVLDDRSLSGILHKLFKSTVAYSCPYSFSFTPGHHMRDWSSLKQNFRNALYLVLQNPSLTTLSLFQLTDLPRDILRNTAIKGISFRQISLSYSNSKPYNITDNSVIFLEFIETDFSFPLLDVLDLTPTRNLSERQAFSRLTNLTAHICNVEVFCDLRAVLASPAQNLEKLTLQLEFYLAFPLPPPLALNLCLLPNLQNLTISQLKTPGPASPSEVQCNTIFQSTAHLFQSSDLAPSLKIVAINIPLGLFPPVKYQSSHRPAFTDVDYTLLDNTFSHSRFCGLALDSLRFIFSFMVYNDTKRPLYEVEEEIRKSSEKWFMENINSAFPAITSTLPGAGGGMHFDVVVEPQIAPTTTRLSRLG